MLPYLVVCLKGKVAVVINHVEFHFCDKRGTIIYNFRIYVKQDCKPIIRAGYSGVIFRLSLISFFLADGMIV